MKLRAYRRPVDTAILILGFALVLCTHSALPGLTLPTLGQAVWTASFAQSFANTGLLSVYATNIGAPQPAAISFGLAGAVPCAWLIRLGIAPFVAYTTMIAMWLGVGYAGAVALCRRLGCTLPMASALAALWLCVPIVWLHENYSMLGLGIALLPTYIWTSVRLVTTGGARGVALLPIVVFVSVFMDGYTFVMFAAAAGIVCLWGVLNSKDPDARRRLILRVVLLHLASFAASILAYKAYVHGGHYGSVPLGMFRAWGMDIEFAMVPTSGEFWVWDALHLSKERDGQALYGDASVWLSTFAAPLLVAAAWGAWRGRRHTLTRGVIAIAVVGMYLSLGPSFKIGTHKPVEVVDASMPATAALAPTGTAWISKHLPGLKLMRAPYRWAALGYCGCWMLIAIGVSGTEGRRYLRYAAVVGATLLLLPHPGRKLNEGRFFQRMAYAIDSEWIGALGAAGLGPKIAFAPHGNDFLAAYAASRLNVTTFNIGGDKNVEQASAEWPAAMANLGDPAQPSSSASIVSFLREGAANQVVIPYVNLLSAAHVWPCPLGFGGAAANIVTDSCVRETKQRYAATLQSLKQSSELEVTDGPLFAVVALKAQFADPAARAAALAARYASIRYPVNVPAEKETARLLLGSGWNPEEPAERWSQARARLTVPLPPSCRGVACNVTFRVMAFAASPDRPVRVAIRSLDDPGASESIVVSDGQDHDVMLSFSTDKPTLDILLEVPEATSPAALGVSQDGRVLGVSLKSIDLQP